MVKLYKPSAAIEVEGRYLARTRLEFAIGSMLAKSAVRHRTVSFVQAT